MPLYADLHIHSKYSRATARNLDLPTLAIWARKKGIALLATGDFTHPGWMAELRDQLVDAGAGTFRLRADLRREVDRRVPPSCGGDTRFILSVEISTIYKRDGRTRKVHHVIYAPSLEVADRLARALGRIGNLASDGRPILGLDSRDLLEVTLEAGGDGGDGGAFLVPAHVWTPWFAALGSRSGFDGIDECYGDLAEHIVAVETGLSSDPPMNWRVSSLDRFRLVSSSDAHSPPALGRNACCLDAAPDYPSLVRALRTGDGYVGTVDMYPEEGKYHHDGHRKCGVSLEPRAAMALDDRCPECGKPLTVGVLHRVELLADREPGAAPPPTAGSLQYQIPLPEILSELLGVGPRSKTVGRVYEGLLARLGPELPLLLEVPLDAIRRAGPPPLAEAIGRLRRGQVIREAGYDGEFGHIRLFADGELDRLAGSGLLFDLPPAEPRAASPTPVAGPVPRVEAPTPTAARGQPAPAPAVAEAGSPAGPLGGLDPDQRRAAGITAGPLLVVAGPGSGKTRTLTHRVAHLVADLGVPARRCLAITFTRRAADELRLRLRALVPEHAEAMAVQTFHGLGLSILREAPGAAGLEPGFTVADEATRAAWFAAALGCTEARARRLLGRLSRVRRTGEPLGELAEAAEVYEAGKRAGNEVDFDDLVARAVDALEGDEALAASWHRRYTHVSVDEVQDLDARQIRLLQLLAAGADSLCAIGDADQAIYGFRGSDARLFTSFGEIFPGTTVVHLSRNYRSGSAIVGAATQVMVAGDGVERRAEAMVPDPERVVIHEAPTERAEAEFVVHSVERLLGGHSFFSIDSGRSGGEQGAALSFGDIAVLVRTDAQTVPVIEALERSGMPYQKHGHAPLSAVPGVADVLGALRGDPPAEALEEAIERRFAASPGAPPEVRRAAGLLLPLARTCGGDLDRLAAEVELGVEADAWDPRAERISLLTIHAAKGLEFPVVFLLGCSDGLLPLRFGPADAVDEAEERRLFYVAMTRAGRRLFLCRARRQRVRGRVRELEPSPFLRPIERQLVRREASTARPRRGSDGQLSMF